MQPERTVHRLRLRAPDAALARRGAVLVEDALRTASLPGEGARLVVIRHLRLPAFRAGCAAQSVALALEARCRAAAIVHVPAGDRCDDGALAAAAAVSFTDSLHAYLCLTRALLEGNPPATWCWPLLVPGYRPGLPRADALARIAAALARLVERDAALPRWLDAVVRRGAGPALLRGLARAPHPQVLAVAPAARPRVPEPAALAAWRGLLDDLARRVPPSPQGAWLAAMAPALAVCDAAPDAAGPVPAIPESVPPLRGGPEKTAPRPGVAAPGARARASPAPAGDGTAPRAPPAGSAPGAPRPRPGAVGPAAPRPEWVPDEGQDRSPPEPFPARPARTPEPAPLLPAPATLDGVPSDAGGLLFLVPVLAGCGLPAWLEVNPDWRALDLPSRILVAVLDRLRIPPRDGFRALAADLEPLVAPPLLRLPQTWRENRARGAPRRYRDGERQALFDASGRLPLAAWRGEPPAHWRLPASAGERVLPAIEALAVQAWITACRRRLRRQVRTGIATLVRRPARVAVTATHVDVWLAPGSVTLPVRRHGLDLDPGWVPWLGRVVRFHYTGGAH